MEDDRPGNRGDGTGDGGGEKRSIAAPNDGNQWGEAESDSGTTADPVAKTADERYCESCGAAIAEAAEICPECGVRAGNEERLTGESSSDEPSGRYLSALVGGIVSFLVGWIPFVGPAAGGVVAGYLRGRDAKESAITGLIANVLAAVPMMGLAVLFMILGGIGAASEGASDVALGLFLWALIFVASFVYFFALGAAGGALGAAITNRRAP